MTQSELELPGLWIVRTFIDAVQTTNFPVTEVTAPRSNSTHLRRDAHHSPIQPPRLTRQNLLVFHSLSTDGVHKSPHSSTHMRETYEHAKICAVHAWKQRKNSTRPSRFLNIMFRFFFFHSTNKLNIRRQRSLPSGANLPFESFCTLIASKTMQYWQGTAIFFCVRYCRIINGFPILTPDVGLLMRIT